MLVLVAPGQGAQTPGFLAPWLEVPGVADRLGRWSDVAGLDLVHAGTEASEDEIKDTAVAQPLLEMGRTALRTGLHQAQGEPLDSHRVELATQLVVRESTAAPRS